MGTESKIGWTRHTLNLWWGCVEVAPECDNCYAREWAKRYDRAKWGAKEPRLYIKSGWIDVHKWQREAVKAGRIDNVFCGSMMDIFERPMPVVNAKGEDTGFTTEDLRREFCTSIVPMCPNLQFLLLSKRPGNIEVSVPDHWNEVGAPANVMYGTSIGTTTTMSKALFPLTEANGRRFLSVEPLLEDVTFPVDLLEKIHWVIIGCESNGSRAGRFAEGYTDAARRIMAQCDELNIPVFHKQMPINGRVSHNVSEWPADLQRQQFAQPMVVVL